MKFPSIQTSKDFDAHFHGEIWREAARQICLRHGISCAEMKRAAQGEHIVFLIDENYALKIYRPFRRCFEREKRALEFVAGKIDFVTPEIVRTGEIGGFDYLLTTQLRGAEISRAAWLEFSAKEQIEFIVKLARGLKSIHRLDAENFTNDWAAFVEDRAATFVERQIAHGVNQKVVDALPAFIEENLKFVPKTEPTVFIHSDFHFGNLRLTNTNGAWKISGLFDFADSRRGFHEYEFLAVGLLIMQGQREVQREFFRAYGYAESELDETMRKRLMMLTMLYETSDLRRYAMRLKPAAVEFSLDELERGIWSFANKSYEIISN